MGLLGSVAGAAEGVPARMGSGQCLGCALVTAALNSCHRRPADRPPLLPLPATTCLPPLQGDVMKSIDAAVAAGRPARAAVVFKVRQQGCHVFQGHAIFCEDVVGGGSPLAPPRVRLKARRGDELQAEQAGGQAGEAGSGRAGTACVRMQGTGKQELDVWGRADMLWPSSKPKSVG